MVKIIPDEIFEKKLWVYLVHPVRGDKQFTTEQNLEKSRELEKIIEKKGIGIVSPWVVMCNYMNDAEEEQRRKGIKYNLETLKFFAYLSKLINKKMELWVYGHTFSTGMKQEIELAKKLGVPVRIKSS
jgi:hypothetical protein